MIFNFFMLENVSGWELLIILFVVYIFFGVKTIPKLFRSFKKTMTEFQNAWHEVKKEINQDISNKKYPAG